MATHTAYKTVQADWTAGTSGYHLAKTYEVGTTVTADDAATALAYMHTYASTFNEPGIRRIADNESGNVPPPYFYGLHVYSANPINVTSNLMSTLFGSKDRDGHVVEVQFDDAHVIDYTPEAGVAPGIDLWRVTQCDVISEVTL
jgi:hypothetical protein